MKSLESRKAGPAIRRVPGRGKQSARKKDRPSTGLIRILLGPFGEHAIFISAGRFDEGIHHDDGRGQWGLSLSYGMSQVGKSTRNGSDVAQRRGGQGIMDVMESAKRGRSRFQVGGARGRVPRIHPGTLGN